MNPPTAASLGAPPRRHRAGDPSNLPSDAAAGPIGPGPNVGTSMSARYGDNEWEARESQRQRELEEARARAAQMEKTMKWWSDCTANWREKWSKVRNERNKAREETKQMRGSLEAAVKEVNSFKREKVELEQQIVQLKQEMEKVHTLMMKHAGQFHSKGDGPEAERRDAFSPDISSDGLKNVNSEDGLMIKSEADRSGDSRDLDIEEYILQSDVPKHVLDSLKEDDRRASAEERRLIQQLSKDDFEDDYLSQKVEILQQRLDEAQKNIQAEKNEQERLQQSIVRLTNDLKDARDKCEDERSAKQDAVRELLTLQEEHQAELDILNKRVAEEQYDVETLEIRLQELRTALERMQADNAAEWGKRERLESDKVALKRENKKLRNDVRALQAAARPAIDAGAGAAAPVPSTPADVRAVQQKLTERSKELAEARHVNVKLKKLLAETKSELGHAGRRAEQYESEVKILRKRVDGLQNELAMVDDELLDEQNRVCQLQRRNEDLLDELEEIQSTNDDTEFLGAAAAGSSRMPMLSPNKHEQFTPIASNASDLTAYDGKPNINDLRQMFDRSRIDCKQRNVMQSSAIMSGQDAAKLAFADAKQSSLDENIFEKGSHSHAKQPAVAPALPIRNVDFERAKQKFDKPNSLRLNTSSQHALHNQHGNRPAPSNVMRLGQSSSGGSRRFIESAPKPDERSMANDANGALTADGGGDAQMNSGYFNMTTSMNLDELKISDDEAV